MRDRHRSLRLVAIVTLIAGSALTAQVTTRDSAGIRIVTSTAPSRPTEAVVVSDTPRLSIGPERGKTGQFRFIRHVAVLSQGRLLVADGASGELRYFDQTGAPLFVRPIAPQAQTVRTVRRTMGDTVAAVTAYDRVVWFDEFGAQINALPTAPPSRAPRTIAMEILSSGHVVHGVLEPLESRAVGQVWAATMPLQLHDRRVFSVVELGRQRFQEMEQRPDGPFPRWLGPIGVIAGGPTHVTFGYGTEYALRTYTLDGTLRSIIRRAWTPVPISDADWETWVVEWSKRWVTSTGEQRVREVQAVREAPWADQLPAFSQAIVDRTGKLWVRTAHWQDAIAAGGLNDVPAVPSEWSVFDRDGAWLYDVTMPANFQVFEIGADYVAGRLVTGGRESAAVFTLRAP